MSKIQASVTIRPTTATPIGAPRIKKPMILWLGLEYGTPNIYAIYTNNMNRVVRSTIELNKKSDWGFSRTQKSLESSIITTLIKRGTAY
jgi:hypothetical protein